MIQDLLVWLSDSFMAQRGRSELPVVDVKYTDLVANPVATVHRVHEQHGLDWTPAIEQTIEEGVANRLQHKQGKHRYELSDFGITETDLKAALGPYIERYLTE